MSEDNSQDSCDDSSKQANGISNDVSGVEVTEKSGKGTDKDVSTKSARLVWAAAAILTLLLVGGFALAFTGTLQRDAAMNLVSVLDEEISNSPGKEISVASAEIKRSWVELCHGKDAVESANRSQKQTSCTFIQLVPMRPKRRP